MTKFKKKPVVIEAIQFKGTPESAANLFEVFDIPMAKFIPSATSLEVGFLAIPTLEGVMTAERNDWIIKGVRGEFYPCKPDIFAETYEEVED